MNDLITRVEEARGHWNGGDLDGYLDLYDDAIRLHGYAPVALDKPSVVGFYQAIWASMPSAGRPNPNLEFQQVMVDGDLYCCRFTMTGVQTGEFMGIPASGLPYELQGMTMMRFAGPRVVERWSTADFLGLMVQLGAIPAPA